MIATDKYIEVMVPLIVQLWPDNTKDEAIEIIEEYLYGEETGAFVHFVDNQCVGLALCSLRHDYGSIINFVGFRVPDIFPPAFIHDL